LSYSRGFGPERVKDYIGQYLGRVGPNLIWLLLHERDPNKPSIWKAITDTKLTTLMKWNIDNIMNTLGEDINEEETKKLEEAQQYFQKKNAYLYSNLVMINDVYDIFAQHKTQDTINKFGEISIYELGYGGDSISATVTPGMVSEINWLIDHLGYKSKPYVELGNTAREMVRNLKLQHEATIVKSLPDGVRRNIADYVSTPRDLTPREKKPGGGKTTRKIKPRMRHRTRKPNHSRRYKRRGNQRKSRRRV